MFTIKKLWDKRGGSRIGCDFTHKGKTVYYDLPKGLYLKLTKIQRELHTTPAGRAEDGLKPPCFDCPSCLILSDKCPYFGGKAAAAC
jgi:hypothetical protein